MAITHDQVGTTIDKAQVISAYITATSNDTTDPVNGKTIDNRDGMVSAVFGHIAATDKTGTSPTVNLILQGSNDGTNWFTLKDDGGNDISTGAQSISSAGGGTTVLHAVDTQQKTLQGFPAFMRWQVDLGGTSPGWTGTVATTIIRNKFAFVKQ